MGSGYATAVANIAITVVQIKAMRDIAGLQMGIYRDRMLRSDRVARLIEERADEQQALWRDHFRDCEVEYVQEVCADEPPKVSYRALAGEINAIYTPRYNASRAEALDARTAFCEPSSCAADRELAVSRASATGWGMEAAARAAEDEHRLLMAQWDERRTWVVNAGHGAYGDPTGALMAANIIYQRGADAAAGTFSGAAAAIGASLRMMVTNAEKLQRTPPQATRPGANQPLTVPVQPAKVWVDAIPPQDKFPKLDGESQNYYLRGPVKLRLEEPVAPVKRRVADVADPTGEN